MHYQLKSGVLAEDHNDGRTRVWGTCRVTKKGYECWAPTPEINDWLEGKKIQEALASVSAEDREFIKTSISPDGWFELFGDPA